MAFERLVGRFLKGHPEDVEALEAQRRQQERSGDYPAADGTTGEIRARIALAQDPQGFLGHVRSWFKDRGVPEPQLEELSQELSTSTHKKGRERERERESKYRFIWSIFSCSRNTPLTAGFYYA